MVATYGRPILWDVLERGAAYNPFPWQARHFHSRRGIKRVIAACGRRVGKSAAMKGEIIWEVSRPPEIVQGVAQSPLVYVVGPTA